MTSLRDLRNQAIVPIEEDLRNGKILKRPPHPCESTIALQFSPIDQTVEAASKFTGQLEVSRKVQRRTLRHFHVDQHFVNATTKHCKEWIVDVSNRVRRKHLRFHGQDDKAKIPVGTDVTMSTGCRIA